MLLQTLKKECPKIQNSEKSVADETEGDYLHIWNISVFFAQIRHVRYDQFLRAAHINLCNHANSFVSLSL